MSSHCVILTLRLTNDHEQMLEFCDSVSPNLTNYEGDGVSTSAIPDRLSKLLFQAWPTLLDDFVSWKMGPTASSWE